MTVKPIFIFSICIAIAMGKPFTTKSLTKTEVLTKLIDFKPNEKTRKMLIKKRQSAKRGEYLSTRVVDEGFLQLGKDDWIYMVTVPSKQHQHDEEGLTLAIDQNGTVYENRAHVCGGIVHFSAKNPPQSAEEFFSTFIDTDSEKKWSRVKQK